MGKPRGKWNWFAFLRSHKIKHNAVPNPPQLLIKAMPYLGFFLSTFLNLGVKLMRRSNILPFHFSIRKWNLITAQYYNVTTRGVSKSYKISSNNYTLLCNSQWNSHWKLMKGNIFTTVNWNWFIFDMLAWLCLFIKIRSAAQNIPWITECKMVQKDKSAQAIADEWLLWYTNIINFANAYSSYADGMYAGEKIHDGNTFLIWTWKKEIFIEGVWPRSELLQVSWRVGLVGVVLEGVRHWSPFGSVFDFLSCRHHLGFQRDVHGVQIRRRSRFLRRVEGLWRARRSQQ